MSVKCLEDCKAVCCECDLHLDLTHKEASDLQMAGTGLAPIRINGGRGDYFRYGRCGFSEDGKCVVYDGSVKIGGFLGLFKKKIDRPEACRQFEPGGRGCLRLRMNNPGLVTVEKPEDREYREWYYGGYNS